MSLYRVKQFYWSITSKIDTDDIQMMDNYLDGYEKELFAKLSIYEQKHSIKVAREVLSVCNSTNRVRLVKIALLHDIGKIYGKLNPFEKSIMVVLDSISKGKLIRLKKIKKVDVYYNHSDKGYKLLKSTGKYDERFLYIIKNHHNNCIFGDKELDIIKRCDSNN